MKTQVGIIGAGPAGLLLAHLLKQRGVESVVIETRSRAYIEARIRAGVLEQGTVELLDEIGVAQRLRAEGLTHTGIQIGLRGQRHHIDFPALTGKSITVYGQHEIVKDLLAASEPRGIPVLFEVGAVQPLDFNGERPCVRFEHLGERKTLNCDFIAGCDGFHGVCRSSVPAGAMTSFEQTYPFSWLGILVQAPPAQEELVYMHSERGFALFSMRSPAITRLYLQVAATDPLADWPDDRIWSELRLRFHCADGWQPHTGAILSKSITPIRSLVSEPMQSGRLLLAGDAAHIVPPTGAKGLNLAASDVRVLAEGLSRFYRSGSVALLARYSEVCLRRVWKVQRFAWWMTSMLHVDPQASAFERRRQLAELDYVTSSRAAATSLAENYVGLPLEMN